MSISTGSIAIVPIAIGSDHAGFTLKTKIINHLQSKGFTLDDKGCYSEESIDYADYAHDDAEGYGNHGWSRL